MELRIREATVDVSVAVDARRWLGPAAAGSGEASGSGGLDAGLRIAAALADVDAIALSCGGTTLPLTLVAKLDGNALIAAAGGAESHLDIYLRAERPAEASLRQGCRLFLPTSFGPYFASMSAPQPVFAVAGGWSELRVTRLALAPLLPAAPPTSSPLATGLLVLGLSLLAARAGFVWGRRKR